MNLIGILRKLGDRNSESSKMSPAEKQTSAPAKNSDTDNYSSELMMTVQISEVARTGRASRRPDRPLEDISKPAGHNAEKASWTVERLQEFLNSDRIRKNESRRCAGARCTLLTRGEIDPADISRTPSCDQHWMRLKIPAFQEAATLARGSANLLSDLSARMKQVEKDIAAEEERWKDWRSQKRRASETWRCLGFLIDRP